MEDFFLKKKEAKKRPLKDNEPTKDNFIDSATPLRTDWRQILTHEETFCFSSCLNSDEFRSGNSRLNRKMFSLRSPFFFGTHFSQIFSTQKHSRLLRSARALRVV